MERQNGVCGGGGGRPQHSAVKTLTKPGTAVTAYRCLASLLNNRFDVYPCDALLHLFLLHTPLSVLFHKCKSYFIMPSRDTDTNG